MRELGESLGMSEHKKRISALARWIAPPEGSPARVRLDAWAAQQKENPSFDKQIKKIYKKAKAISWSQLETGAGLPMDQLVRHFANEYNWRNLQKGLLSMPGSFNVMEAFFRYDPANSVFRILDESDHLISFMEFLDFLTSGDCPEDIRGVAENIEEDIIHSYNLTNDPGAITFSVDDGSEFAVGGVSLIRQGAEISILLLAGEKTDLKAKTESLKERLKGSLPAPGKEWLRGVFESADYSAVPLLENPEYWQVLVLTRLNVETMTQDVRYLFWDAGASFIQLTDDVNFFLDEQGNYILPEWQKSAREFAERIKKYAAIFEVCKSCIFLPLYFEAYGDEVVDERHPTQFSESKHDLKRVQRNQLLGPKEKVLFRRVSVLRREIERQPDIISFKAPDFEMEVSGFWRRLNPNQIGADKYGKPIHGRTWVKRTLSWIEPVEAEALRVKTSSDEEVVKSSGSPGYIYVMRSAAHDKDIFKIGLTTRGSDVRSDELSRATGSPDKFLVAQDWKVSDCALAEKLIHERLDQYRINPKREFFQAPYKTISQGIHEVLAKLGEG
jgi:hypothetical protein